MNKQAAHDYLATVTAEYRKQPYSYWRQRIGQSPIIVEYVPPGESRVVVIEIDAMWDGRPEENIRVVLDIAYDFRTSFFPVCDDFIISAVGQFIGERSE